MKKQLNIVLPRLPFPRSAIKCDVVSKKNAAAKELAEGLKASFCAKYLVSLASGRSNLLPGKVGSYWAALQDILEVTSQQNRVRR